MKRMLCALLAVLLLCTALPLAASAEEMMNFYYSDGRMATVPASMADQCRADGWTDWFPYCGMTIWITDTYLTGHTTDLYGTPTYQILSNPLTYTQATVVWYDDQDFVSLGGYQKQLKTLIIDVNGTQLKMPFGDFLRGRWELWDTTQIYWENPKTLNGVSDESWNRIQNGEFWLGMPANEFLLYQQFPPDRINKSDYGYGVLEQWVYDFSNGVSYYYFENGVLTSYQRY